MNSRFVTLSTSEESSRAIAHAHPAGLLAALGMAVSLLTVPAAHAAAVTPRVLLLDGAVVGTEVIAVGERGTILRSTDNARTWQPCVSPVRVTLTGVSFATQTAPRLGWAVGHDAQIVATTDAGHTWVKQFQGESLQDSFLDVLALDAQRVIAVGAYGLCFVTTNGGTTWTRRKVSADDYHLNRITRGPSGALFIAGEHGTLLRSDDGGDTWTAMPVAYTGSFYGIVPLDRRTLLAHGLRGNIYRSADDGQTWQPIASPGPALLATAVKLKSNTLVFAGQARTLLVSRDDGKSLAILPAAPATGVAELLELPDGNVLALGESGAIVMPKP